MIFNGQRLDFDFIRQQLKSLPDSLACLNQQISASILFVRWQRARKHR